MKILITTSAIALSLFGTISFDSSNKTLTISMSQSEAAYCYSGSKRMRRTRSASRTAAYEAAGWSCYDAPEVVVRGTK